MQELIREIIRNFRRGPIVAAIIVLTVATGVAINTSVLSLAYAMVVEPLPFPRVSELVQITVVEGRNDPTVGSNRFTESYLNHQDYEAATHSFDGYATYAARTFSWTGRGEPQNLAGASVSADFFRVLGAKPQLGRWPTPNELRANAAVAVISHDLWRVQLGGSPVVLGTVLSLNDRPYEIVGVLPPRATLPLGADVWTPLAPTDDQMKLRSWKALSHVGRLRAGTTLRQAQAEFDAIGAQAARDYPETNKNWRPYLVPLTENLLQGNDRSVLTLQLAALLLLVMTTFNMATLIYAQAVQRSQETAVRLALGAESRHLLRLSVVGTLALVVPGVLFGLVGAQIAAPLLSQINPNPAIDYFFAGLTLQPAVAVASAVFSIGLGACSAVLPALQFRSVSTASVLRESTRGGSASPRVLRVQGLLIQTQFAFSAILLTGAVLLGLSYDRLNRADQGFSAEGRTAVTFALPPERYGTTDAYRRFVRQLQDSISAETWHHGATVSANLPAGDLVWFTNFGIVPRDNAEPRFELTLYSRINETYFATIGQRLDRGRNFAVTDGPDAPPVAIVNEAFAAKNWPGQDPVGQLLVRRRGARMDPPCLVVGVVANTFVNGPRDGRRPIVYQPLAQSTLSVSITLLVNSPLAATEAIELTKAAVRKIDPLLPTSSADTLANRLSATIALERFQSQLLTGLSVFGVAITLLGMAGLISRVVAARASEFAVRKALGATPWQIAQLLLRRQGGLILTGILSGAFAAWLIASRLTLPLYGLSVNSPLPYAVAATVLVALASLSLLPPLVKAARTDPVNMLRQ